MKYERIYREKKTLPRCVFIHKKSRESKGMIGLTDMAYQKFFYLYLLRLRTTSISKKASHISRITNLDSVDYQLFELTADEFVRKWDLYCDDKIEMSDIDKGYMKSLLDMLVIKNQQNHT